MEPATTTSTILGVGAAFLILYLAYCAVGGLIVGALARLVLPGPDPMSWLATLGFGLGGSLIGGFVTMVLHVPRVPGILISVACAAGLIWYFRRRRPPTAPPTAPPTSPPPAS
jgi:uncharacterized membrane protein YeaQ/YmgE (transglycosylase-associated protein family)